LAERNSGIETIIVACSEAQRDAVKKNMPILKDKVHDHLADLRGKLEKGSGWEKWNGWYKPEHFRVFTPPPTLDELDKVLNSNPLTNPR